jgi:hypothetical protein
MFSSVDSGWMGTSTKYHLAILLLSTSLRSIRCLGMTSFRRLPDPHHSSCHIRLLLHQNPELLLLYKQLFEGILYTYMEQYCHLICLTSSLAQFLCRPNNISKLKFDHFVDISSNFWGYLSRIDVYFGSVVLVGSSSMHRAISSGRRSIMFFVREGERKKDGTQIC